jgi:hypothetical protein
MNATEQEQFMVRLAVLAEIYGEPMSPTRLEGYTQLLGDQDIRDLAPALEACAKVCTFFPKPIDILDGIQTVRCEREQARVQRVLSAYVEPVSEGITEEQWQERWQALKGIMDRVPMKPHDGLEGDRCQCADHKRQREEARRAA